MVTSHDHHLWLQPTLSTVSADAGRHYRDGIVDLVARAAHHRSLLLAAIAADPDFHLARLALAVADAEAGRPFEVPSLAGRLTRGERQHTEIVGRHLADDVGRCHDLRPSTSWSSPATCSSCGCPHRGGPRTSAEGASGARLRGRSASPQRRVGR